MAGLTYVDCDGIGHRVSRSETFYPKGIQIVNLACGNPGRYKDITSDSRMRDVPVTCMTCLVIGHKD